MRRYREIATTPHTHAEQTSEATSMERAQAQMGGSDMNAPGAPAVSAAAVAVHWTAPEGWVEQRGNPMRIATFLVGSEKAECTLTAFPGTVGGIEENLQRWAGQINLRVSAGDLAKFARAPTAFKTEGDFPCLVYDFASVAPDAEPSMLAAILPLDEQTLFVKLTGSRALLAEQKEAFTALCRSLRP
ncbi:MAG: hypothetical protein M5U15_14815 [Kiritimatiellae bacterium]|nr:hypothetical protein [Kiritimatiellia bacterium]